MTCGSATESGSVIDEHAQTAVQAFARSHGAKFLKATAKITDDEDVLLSLYGYPAEHWIHLRMANPIESTFATVRLRTRVTCGAGSPTAALAMTFISNTCLEISSAPSPIPPSSEPTRYKRLRTLDRARSCQIG